MLLLAVGVCSAQQSLNWEQVRSRFEATNPTLKANALTVEEAHAQEITAYLRPNPQLTLSTDGTQIVPHDGVWQPIKGTDFVPNVSYLHKREHKRELRLKAPKKGRALRSRNPKMPGGTSSSRFAAHSSIRCRQKRCLSLRKPNSNTTTTSSK